MEEVRFVRVVDQLARHVRLAERYVESELRCASAGDLLEYRPGSLFRAKSRGKALIQRRGLGIERRATKDGAIVFAYHEIPHRLEEPAVSTGSRTKDLRLGHRHIAHLLAPAVAGDSHSLGIDQAFGNPFPDRILATQRAIDPDQVLPPLAQQGTRRSPLQIGREHV